jgi:hypothetical protein
MISCNYHLLDFSLSFFHTHEIISFMKRNETAANIK